MYRGNGVETEDGPALSHLVWRALTDREFDLPFSSQPDQQLLITRLCYDDSITIIRTIIAADHEVS